MIRPNVYLMIIRRANIDLALEAMDGYDMPTDIQVKEESSARIEDCIDDEDGTLDF